MGGPDRVENRSPSDSWAFHAESMTLEQLSDALTTAGIDCDGLSETSWTRPRTATAWFSIRPTDPLPVEGRWERVVRADWAEAWKADLQPVRIGRITVTLPWLAPEGPVLGDAPDGDIVLVIEPNLAFGTGHHETTAGCLDALQRLPLAGRHVVDVGTGTGVLALAARALGAESVTAVDNDPTAIEVAAANIAAHGLDGIELIVGSCAEVTRPGDVVVANIITDHLLALAPELVALLADDATLITSGVSLARTDEAVTTFARHGVELRADRGREWTLMVGQLKAPRLLPGP